MDHRGGLGIKAWGTVLVKVGLRLVWLRLAALRQAELRATRLVQHSMSSAGDRVALFQGQSSEPGSQLIQGIQDVFFLGT
jgi:hypothetical protein